MTSPKTKDLTWVRGTTPSLVVTFERNDEPITFDDARISVYSDKGRTFAWRATAEDGDITIDAGLGQITFRPTADQTRMLTQTKDNGVALNRYEIELRDGEIEEVYLIGAISAIGGLNDDIGDEEVS